MGTCQMGRYLLRLAHPSPWVLVDQDQLWQARVFCMSCTPRGTSSLCSTTNNGILKRSAGDKSAFYRIAGSIERAAIEEEIYSLGTLDRDLGHRVCPS